MADSPDLTVSMIFATRVMKPGRSRIGRIGRISLPRTIPVAYLVAGIVGGLFGALVGVAVGGSTRSILMGTAFGAMLGVGAVAYQPFEGESLWTFLGLTWKSRRTRIEVNGHPARLAIGICPVSRAAAGPILLHRSAVTVPPSQYDERGVLISARNHNLDRAHVSTLLADLLDGHAAPLPPLVPSRRSTPEHPPAP